MLVDPRGRPLVSDELAARRKPKPPGRALSTRRESRTGLPFLMENLTRSVDDKPESPYRLFPATDREIAAHLGFPAYDHTEEDAGMTYFCSGDGAILAGMPTEDWEAHREAT